MKWWMKAAIPAIIMPAMLVVGYRSSPAPAPPAAEAPAQPALPRPERKAVETKADDTVARHEKARLELAAEADAAKRKADADRSAEPELSAKEELDGVGGHNPLGRSPAPLMPAEMRRAEDAPGEPALVSEADEDCKTCRQVATEPELRVSFKTRKKLGGGVQTYAVVQNPRDYPQNDVVVKLTLGGRTMRWHFGVVPAKRSVTGLQGLDVPRRPGYQADLDVSRGGVPMVKHRAQTRTVCDPGTGVGSLAFREPGK